MRSTRSSRSLKQQPPEVVMPPPFPWQMRAVEVVTGAGEVLRVSRADPDPAMRDVFEACTISLGGVGVITEVTLAVVPAFSVVKVREGEP